MIRSLINWWGAVYLIGLVLSVAGLAGEARRGRFYDEMSYLVDQGHTDRQIVLFLVKTILVVSAFWPIDLAKSVRDFWRHLHREES